mmetsp:Transcript_16739/g.37042  ORF Transcript_16739/g.37042 Transcript_16739/m.37042 type:complete len:212 (-) Transcript_16739:950-1585(-)
MALGASAQQKTGRHAAVGCVRPTLPVRPPRSRPGHHGSAPKLTVRRLAWLHGSESGLGRLVAEPMYDSALRVVERRAGRQPELSKSYSFSVFSRSSSRSLWFSCLKDSTYRWRWWADAMPPDPRLCSTESSCSREDTSHSSAASRSCKPALSSSSSWQRSSASRAVTNSASALASCTRRPAISRCSSTFWSSCCCRAEFATSSRSSRMPTA